jgi:hypothetical protein
MMRRGCLLLFLALAVAAVTLTFVGRPSSGNQEEASTAFEPNKALFATVASANQFQVYEGLPHPNNEEMLFLRERATSRTIRLDGFLFYGTPVDVPAADAAVLKDLLGTERSFLAWRGEKKCGGFHPDYLAEWRAGADSYRVQICFGCGEVKVHGPASSLRCDMQNESRQRLEGLLKKYRTHRPLRSGS